MNRFPNAQWVFFDVGYTLLDETPAWAPLFSLLSAELAREGRPTTVEQIWQTFRQGCSAFQMARDSSDEATATVANLADVPALFGLQMD